MLIPFFLFMDFYEQKMGIKMWAEADRPREKLMLNGRRHLTDAELIAILIGSGNRTETAVDLSKRMLAGYNYDLDAFGKATVTELSKFKGIGEAKAITIVAALELGRRRKESAVQEVIKVGSSHDAFQHLHADFTDLNHEEFWMLLLNRANHIKSKHLISKGGQSGTVADPKIIFKTALEHQAAYIILAHNHPSGNLKPSNEDLKLTKKLVEAGKLLDLLVVDHLIITDRSYYSFCDEGLI
jgi:DNA repair protein RadC